MPPASQIPKWRLAAGALVALALLNSSLTFENVWPTPKIRGASAISIELTVSVLLLAIAHRWAGTLARRVLPALWVILVVGHYLDVTAPGLYGREFNVYWDSQHLGNVAAMLSSAAPTWLILLAAVSLIAVFVTLFVIARIALGWLASAMEWPVARRALGAGATLLLVIFAAQQLFAPSAAVVSFADAVTPAYARQVRFVLAMVGPGAVAPELGPTPDLNNSLARLEGADVLLLFVESYGAITYETPAIADGLVESRADLAAAVAETDREVVTAYVESPTFGGGSWLAHLSLISGVEVRDQYAYTALMASSRETMVTNFARRGYRTVALLPGMRQAWPEGAFYHYDQIYGRDLLDYRGPEFGWWSIPDQYALAKIDALERNRLTRKPVFIVFPTSTTHAPFGPVAPYQPDWSRMLASDAFAKADVERSLAATPDLANLRPSYTHAMSYRVRNHRRLSPSASARQHGARGDRRSSAGGRGQWPRCVMERARSCFRTARTDPQSLDRRGIPAGARAASAVDRPDACAGTDAARGVQHSDISRAGSHYAVACRFNHAISTANDHTSDARVIAATMVLTGTGTMGNRAVPSPTS